MSFVPAADAPVLIIAPPGDVHALVVAQRLQMRHGVEAIMWDSSRFPAEDTLSLEVGARGGWNATLHSLAAGAIRLDQVRSIWWRRPKPASIGELVEDPFVRTYCRAETDRCFRGIVSALNLKVFNNPTLEDQANRKTFQLACASECGLPVPRTLVTNDSEAVKRFAECNPAGVIFKPFVSPEGSFCVTKDLLPEHLERGDLLANAPVIFQERIPPYKDIRVTVAGGKLFAGESQSLLLDWRTDVNVRWKAHQLARDWQQAILRLVGRLGLDFGSLDFRMRPNGDYVFFEINPNGQFLFLEIDDAELPVSAAIADVLFSARKVDVSTD